MLIICSGADSFRSRRKARELENAFRIKYDPAGLAIERIASNEDAVDHILQKANIFNLFSPRRFFRAQGLLTDLDKAKNKALATTLERAPEAVIIVTIEDKALSKTSLKAFEGVKIVSYDFPILAGKDWTNWVAQEAAAAGIRDEIWTRALAFAAEGDGWFAHNAITKAAAAGLSPIARREAAFDFFERADRFLKRTPSRFAEFSRRGINAQSEFINKILFSARSAIRVRDGAGENLHPYALQKLSRLCDENWDHLLASSIITLACSRSSFCDDEEAPTLLP